MRTSASQHFDSIAAQYMTARTTWECLYRQIRPILAPLIRDQVVLDVGNGGVFAYDTAEARSVVAVDISPAMLAGINRPGVDCVVGDARDLAAIRDSSIDVALYCFSVHHITGATVEESLRNLDAVLGSAARVLRPGGVLVLAEPVIRGQVLWWLERRMYPAVHRFLQRRHASMALFYDLSTLTACMSRHLRVGQEDLRVTPLRLEGWSDPLGGTLPGRVRLPPWLHPARHCLLTGGNRA